MQWLVEQQIRLIVSWQRIDVIAEPMHWISRIGYDWIPFLIICVAFGYSRRVGIELFLLSSFSEAMLNIFKIGFRTPRPYWVDPQVLALDPSWSYGMPSGHVQVAATVFFFLAWVTRHRLVWLIASLGVTLISASRIYLGSHFIHDAVGGAIMGGVVVVFYIRMREKIESLVTESKNLKLIVCAGIIAGFLVSVGFFLRFSMVSVKDDVLWSDYSRSARNLDSLLKCSSKFLCYSAASLFGRKLGSYRIAGHLWKRLSSIVYAIGGYLAIGWLFSVISAPTGFGMIFAFGQEFLLASWILLVVPLILKRCGILTQELLAKSEDQDTLARADRTKEITGVDSFLPGG